MELSEKIRSELCTFLESELKGVGLSEKSTSLVVKDMMTMPADEFSKIARHLNQEEFVDFFIKLHRLSNSWKE